MIGRMVVTPDAGQGARMSVRDETLGLLVVAAVVSAVVWHVAKSGPLPLVAPATLVQIDGAETGGR